jgi:hypothetical protein
MCDWLFRLCQGGLLNPLISTENVKKKTGISLISNFVFTSTISKRIYTFAFILFSWNKT